VKKAHKSNKTKAQPLRVTRATATGGVKVCPKPLERIIELANIAGNESLPDLDFRAFRETDGIPLAEFLPDAVRLNLLEVWSNPKTWKMSPEEWMALGEPGIWSTEDSIGFLRAAATADRYALIRGSRDALLSVTSGAEVFPVTTFLKRVGAGKEARATYAGDPISDALLGAEIHYIRRCETCGKFFYAQRDNQETCPPEERGKASHCAGRRRSRQKRKNDRLKRQLENKRAIPNVQPLRIALHH
jgi:hypothetical protein